jgi:nitrogen fixation protein NifQ
LVMAMNKERFEEIISTAESKLESDWLPDWRQDEFNDLVKLLMMHKTEVALDDSPDVERLARAIAISCLGSNHLWQDMELTSRDELCELISIYFKPISDKNYKDMKWKKFFYRQICGWEGFLACRSPSCEVCIDYDECFGPES